MTKIVSMPEETGHIRATLGIPDDYGIPSHLAIACPREDTVWPEQVSVDIDDRLRVDQWGF